MEHRSSEKVVIIGAGFGGLEAARTLARLMPQLDLTVIDRANHHLFQPLLYQVATAGLAPEDIAYPIRGIFRNSPNVSVLYREVIGVDVARKRVLFRDGDELAYAILVMATGAGHHYFGHDDWSRHAPGLKSVQDAMEIRKRILLAFEEAEAEEDPARRESLLQFVVIGGGPTGVELAGAIAELAHTALASDFHRINPRSARIALIEAGPRLLPGFAPELGKAAHKALLAQQVEVLLGAKVTGIDGAGVDLEGRRLVCRTKIWAAGIRPSSAAKWLGAPADPAGRAIVEPNLTIPGHPEVFCIGDTALVLEPKSGSPLPAVAPVAMQQGRYVGSLVANRIRKRKAVRPSSEEAPFRYDDRGSLATVGRSFAVAQLGKRRLAGRIAWWMWLWVHIIYLIGFRNRVSVLIQWAYAYLTFHRGARLILESADGARKRPKRVQERIPA